MKESFLITWYRRDAHIQHTLAPPSMIIQMSELTNPRDRRSHHWSDGLDQSKESISNITNKYVLRREIAKFLIKNKES
jgi:hypothetical protein